MKESLNKRELTISASKAQIYALVFVIPILITFGLPFHFFWPENLSERNFSVSIPNGFIIFIIIIIGIIVHELIHGITWAIFTRKGFKSIHFGVMWKSLTPFCHCSEPLTKNQYIAGGVMPAVVLGFLPSVIAIVTGNLSILLLGLFFTFAAGGDFLIIWMLRNENRKSLIQDHPTMVGCYIFDGDNGFVND